MSDSFVYDTDPEISSGHIYLAVPRAPPVSVVENSAVSDTDRMREIPKSQRRGLPDRDIRMFSYIIVSVRLQDNGETHDL